MMDLHTCIHTYQVFRTETGFWHFSGVTTNHFSGGQ